MGTIVLPKPKRRTYLPQEFKVSVWGKLKPYYQELLQRPIESVEALERWILNYNEVDALTSEDFARRYIKISVDSNDQKSLERYQYAAQELSPHIASFENKLNQKLVNSPFFSSLDEETYQIYLRSLRNEVRLFRTENIPLKTELRLKTKEHGKIFSEMTIEMEGEQMTLQQAANLLEENDRPRREEVFRKSYLRMREDAEPLEELFDDLLRIRHQMALNADFENYRDYKFQVLGRFDYRIEDCFHFHNSIAHEIVPVVNRLYQMRKQELGLADLRPWDLDMDASGEPPLRPYQNVEELIEKSITCLSRVDPFFGECLAIMQEMGHLDLDSRKGKRPGGYNMPLHLTGVPFVFMNAANSTSDMRTLMHESGHAVHSFLTRDYDLLSHKRVPSEVAELAAMTMELLTMEHWGVFFENEADLRRAKFRQLENILEILPWIATIDKFQHWLYTHPEHTREDRKEAWSNIWKEFSAEVVDFEGLDDYREYRWHKQLHIFEVPFYYIEYGMAQLGALAIWKQYSENPQVAIENYKNMLQLGYTKSIPEIYQTAGIEFNFSREYVRELAIFVQDFFSKI